MGIISDVVDIIDNESIKAFINVDIDRKYHYCEDWESEHYHVCRYLDALLTRRLRKADKTCEGVSQARSALKPVTREKDIPGWLDQLKNDYFPVLEQVW